MSWLRQEENQYLSVPHEVARTLPEPLLRLMGYARGAYALGYVDDLRDPLEIVRPDLKTQGFGDLSNAAQQAKAQLDGRSRFQRRVRSPYVIWTSCRLPSRS